MGRVADLYEIYIYFSTPFTLRKLRNNLNSPTGHCTTLKQIYI